MLFYKRVCHTHTYAVSVCGVRILALGLIPDSTALTVETYVGIIIWRKIIIC